MQGRLNKFLVLVFKLRYFTSEYFVGSVQDFKHLLENKIINDVLLNVLDLFLQVEFVLLTVKLVLFQSLNVHLQWLSFFILFVFSHWPDFQVLSNFLF